MLRIDLYRADFNDKRYTFYNGKFYKLIDFVRQENLIYLWRNKDSLTEELYIFPNGFYETKDGLTVYETDILEKSITLDVAIYLGMLLDTKKISLSLATVLEELESIGLEYYDFHGGNALIDSDFNVKVCDLDSALRTPELLREESLKNDALYQLYGNKITNRKLLISFILQLLTIPEDYSSPASLLNYDYIINKLQILEYFKPEVKEYIEYLNARDESALSTSVRDIVSKMFDSASIDKINEKMKCYNLRKQG